MNPDNSKGRSKDYDFKAGDRLIKNWAMGMNGKIPTVLPVFRLRMIAEVDAFGTKKDSEGKYKRADLYWFAIQKRSRKLKLAGDEDSTETVVKELWQTLYGGQTESKK